MSADKFDFLMYLTKTTNSSFAQYSSYDVSYISKIRSGKRRFPKDPLFLSSASAFFADQIRACNVEYAASSILNGSREWPSNTDEARTIICNWLNSESDQLARLLRSYLEERDSSLQGSDVFTVPDSTGRKEAAVSFPPASILTFYGNSGKRSAFLRAFELLCKDPQPYELMIYSDESLTWFSEDKDFFDTWRDYCFKLIKNGSKFTVINFLNRNSEEMREGLRMWTPLILTGAVKAYHCDRVSDNIFNRTLCIAEGKLAITSNSLRLSDCHTVNTMYLEKEAVDTLSDEFRRYLSICQPLFTVFSSDNALELNNTVSRFSEYESDMIYVGYSPALFTFSSKISRQICKRTGCIALYSETVSLSADFSKLLKSGHSVYEILFLPDKKSLIDGKIPIAMNSLFEQEPLFYTPEEYLLLLENMLELSKEFDTFRIIAASSRKLPDNAFLMCKSGGSAFLGVSLPKEMVFHVTDPGVVSSLNDTVLNLISISGIQTINRFLIKNYISDVRNLMKKSSMKKSSESVS